MSALGNGWDKSAGMSVNAVRAYEEGLVPLSKINAAVLEKYGIDYSVSDFKALCRAGLIPHEYHHTSGAFNKTLFYDLDISECLEDARYRARLAAFLEEQAKARAKAKARTVEYYWLKACWEESERNRFGGWNLRGAKATGIVIDDYFYYFSYGAVRRKNIYGTRFRVIERLNKQPRGIDLVSEPVLARKALFALKTKAVSRGVVF